VDAVQAVRASPGWGRSWSESCGYELTRTDYGVLRASELVQHAIPLVRVESFDPHWKFSTRTVHGPSVPNLRVTEQVRKRHHSVPSSPPRFERYALTKL
jgi:hypothetical protein